MPTSTSQPTIVVCCPSVRAESKLGSRSSATTRCELAPDCFLHQTTEPPPQTSEPSPGRCGQAPTPASVHVKGSGLGGLQAGKGLLPRRWFLIRNAKFTVRRGIWVCHSPFHSLGLCFKSEMPNSRGRIPGYSK